MWKFHVDLFGPCRFIKWVQCGVERALQLFSSGRSWPSAWLVRKLYNFGGLVGSQEPWWIWLVGAKFLLLIFLETKRGILNLILCKYGLSFLLAVHFICCLGMIHHLQKCKIRAINRTKMRSFLWCVILAFKAHIKLILGTLFTPYFWQKEI